LEFLKSELLQRKKKRAGKMLTKGMFTYLLIKHTFYFAIIVTFILKKHHNIFQTHGCRSHP